MLVYAKNSAYGFSLSASLYFKDTMSAAIKWVLSFFDSNKPDSKSAGLIKKHREPKNKSAEQDSEPTGICCASCHALLTHAKHAISIDGKHNHIVTNPMGITFKIGTYRQVDCKAEATSESDFSWFTGYAWRIIACPDCREHIGWSYQKGLSPDFYGLIVDKLIDLGKL